MSRLWERLCRSRELHGGTANGTDTTKRVRSEGGSVGSQGGWPRTSQGGASGEVEAGGSPSRKVADLVAQVRELGAEHVFEGVQALGEVFSRRDDVSLHTAHSDDSVLVGARACVRACVRCEWDWTGGTARKKNWRTPFLAAARVRVGIDESEVARRCEHQSALPVEMWRVSVRAAPLLVVVPGPVWRCERLV